MNESANELIRLFKGISNKGWIEGIGKSWGNIGLTFEKEINKLPDSEYTPDFKDIEIKCSSRYSRYPIYLFTIAFDGPGESEILRIANEYGFPDPDFPDKNVIFRRLSNTYNQSNKYNMMLDVDRKEERVYLCVFDSNGVLLERRSYITFDNLEKHLYTKLKKLAFIKASHKKIDSKDYYRYYEIFLYELKDFETFLNLIEQNKLDIWLISRISKSGSDKGRYRNKNIEFSIKKENLIELFDCYACYNHDKYY